MSPDERKHIYDCLKKWLKLKRDENCGCHWDAIDAVLDEVRVYGVQGKFPWEVDNGGERITENTMGR